MGLTEEQLIAYINNKKESQDYLDCEQSLQIGSGTKEQQLSDLSKTVMVNGKKLNLLSAFAQNQLTPEQNAQLITLCTGLHGEYIFSNLFAIEFKDHDRVCVPLYSSSGNKTKKLADFWLQHCLDNPSMSNVNLDAFMKKGLAVLFPPDENAYEDPRAYAASEVEIRIKSIKIALPESEGQCNILGLWVRHANNPRIADTLYPTIKTYFDPYKPLRCVRKNIALGKGKSTNLISLWANNHTNSRLTTLLWACAGCYLTDREIRTLMLDPVIAYQGENKCLIDLAHQTGPLGEVSRQKIHYMINNGINDQVRYQLLCHILEGGKNVDLLSSASRNTLRDKINQLAGQDTYRHWLANALLAARKPKRIERVKYPIAALSLVGLVGTSGALLLWHFVWAMPMLLALLHPAWLAAGAGTVLCVIAALLLFCLDDRSVSAIGQINEGEYQPATRSDSPSMKTTAVHSKRINRRAQSHINLHDDKKRTQASQISQDKNGTKHH